MAEFAYRLKKIYSNHPEHQKGTVVCSWTDQELEWLSNPDNAEKINFIEAEVPKEYLEILKNPDVFKIYINEMKKKIVGEESTKATIFLITNGRFVRNKKQTSDNLVVNSTTGAGKDWTLSNVLALLPKEQYVRRTRISEATFTYWHNAIYEPDWDWQGKAFYCEDVSEKVFNCEVVKTMSSGGSYTTVVIKQKAVDIEIKGKPTMLFTFAKNNPEQEMLRRYPICTLDETDKQTESIMDREAEAAEEGFLQEYDEKLIEAQRYLKPVKVKVPFAKQVRAVFPEKNLIFRTQFGRFLDYIKFSAAFHQFQRQTDEEGFLLAEAPLDYELARLALLKTTTNKYMIPITKDQQKIIEIMTRHFREFGSIEDIAGKVTFLADTALRTNLNALADFGFLEKDVKHTDGIPKPILVYRFVSFEPVAIPTWEEICRNCENTKQYQNKENGKTYENTQNTTLKGIIPTEIAKTTEGNAFPQSIFSNSKGINQNKSDELLWKTAKNYDEETPA